MQEFPYNRSAAVNYARTWALSRNPRYYNFEKLGGDCTNFASQCIYAGSGVMNDKKVTGWYYNSVHDRTPSWSGVTYLYNFLVQNKGAGPFAVETNKNEMQPGDIIQFSNAYGRYYHSPVIVSIGKELLVAAHSIDVLDKPVSAYEYVGIRYLHIVGYRK